MRLLLYVIPVLAFVVMATIFFFANLGAPAPDAAPELYGIVSEDNSAATLQFLKETADPFARLDLDADGGDVMAWGIYGVPETL